LYLLFSYDFDFGNNIIHTSTDLSAAIPGIEIFGKKHTEKKMLIFQLFFFFFVGFVRSVAICFVGAVQQRITKKKKEKLLKKNIYNWSFVGFV